MGGQNSDSHRNWWSNSGVGLVVWLHDSHCLCKWRPQSVVQSLMWPQNCDSELRILIGRRHVTPEFWFASKFSGQTRVLTWSFCCTILIPVQMDALSSSFKALGDPKTCHSELRVLYCICGTESSWPKASRYHCIPYVMGGGWELCIHIRLVGAPATSRITLPYLTLN